MRQLFFLLLLCLINPVFAYQVEPMISHIDTLGANNRISYRVINTSNQKLPLEVAVMRRTFDAQGKEKLTPAEDDFLVLPPQTTVAPGQYQMFRAQYIGPPVMAESASYRIIFKQLALQGKEKVSSVKMLFNFATLVMVSPQDVEGNLQTSVNCQAEECLMTMTNTGSGVVSLLEGELSINGKTAADWETLQNIIPASYLMPSQEVSFSLGSLIETTDSVSSATYHLQ